MKKISVDIFFKKLSNHSIIQSTKISSKNSAKILTQPMKMLSIIIKNILKKWQDPALSPIFLATQTKNNASIVVY